MLGLGMLDVAIGIIFVFLLVSLICTAINEFVESLIKLRSVDLEQGIRGLLNDSQDASLTQKLYDHPLIYSLFKGNYNPGEMRSNNDPTKVRYTRGSNLPSYVPAKNFAIALMDTVAGHWAAGDNPFKDFRSVVMKIPTGNDGNEKLKKALLAITDSAQNDADKVREGIENWYNSTMDRVSGWYKKRVQRIVFVMGFVIAILMNVDTIAIFTNLANDRPLRDAIVTAAKDYKGNATDSAIVNARIHKNVDSLLSLGLPIGWGWRNTFNPGAIPNLKAIPDSPGGWLLKILGWFITGMAVSLGAPFWFDILGKIMVVRSTVKPHEKSPEEASQDR